MLSEMVLVRWSRRPAPWTVGLKRPMGILILEVCEIITMELETAWTR